VWNLVQTLIFVLFIGPGPVIGYVPWVLSEHWQLPEQFGPLQWIGPGLILTGSVPLIESIARFVTQGRGTLAPYAPTDVLVVKGFYRWVRNPMYLGVAAMIFGQALLFASTAIAVYGAFIVLAFHCFVVFYEEPTLRSRYAGQYVRYCETVHRWLPQRPKPIATGSSGTP